MLYFVIIMVALTVAAAALVLAPHMAEGRIIYDTEPDRPCAFGYKMAWLAIRSRDPAFVAERLGLVAVEPANWRSGLGTVYDDQLGETHIFVSPPVNGWVFVAGLPLPHPMGRRFTDKASQLLLGLGADFVEVQYFFSYPAIDFFAWARMIEGKLIRAFAIGDDGVVWNKGRPTKEEKAMGLKLFELRGVRGRRGDAGGEIILYPTEQHMMQLAGKWSLDPTELERTEMQPGLGWIGRAPVLWRPERLRKAA